MSEKNLRSSSLTKLYQHPHHIKNAKKTIENSIKKVDLLIEVYDARIPYTSQKSSFSSHNKEKIILFNKADLAEDSWNQKWYKYYQKKNPYCLFISLKNKQNLQSLQNMLRSIQQRFAIKYKKKNIQPPAIRLMVLGLPNTGKSTLINYLIGKKKVATGSKPGVTLYSQWVKLRYQMEILDTPGILPIIAPEEDSLHKLYATNALQQNLELEILSLHYLWENYKKFRLLILKKYNLKTESLTINLEQSLKKIGQNYRNIENLYQKIFVDFHQGAMSQITLDSKIPDENEPLAKQNANIKK